MRLLVIAGLLGLSACNAYQPAGPYPQTPNERQAAQGCLLDTADVSVMPFGLIGGVASYPSDQSAMDSCMLAHGWERRQ